MSPKRVVFKKVSRDKSVTVYLPSRDFVDHCDHVDPVDGVIVVDPSQLRAKRGCTGAGAPATRVSISVYVMLSCTFQYGRQDVDVMGVAFRRDLFVVTRQVFPELQDKEQLTHSKIQEKLLRKLDRNAFPFFLEFPDNLPNSVTLQPGPSDVGKKCAVEFEVKVFCADCRGDKMDKESSVRLSVRKIQYSPRDVEASPVADATFDFLMSDKPLHVKLSLPKETFYHGEPVQADVEITNGSNRNVKDISLSVAQVTNVILYSNDKYVKSVAKEETWVKREVLKELQGMLVSYKLLLKMTAAGPLGSSEVCVELPFRLMHPKPEAASLTTSPSRISNVLSFAASSGTGTTTTTTRTTSELRRERPLRPPRDRRLQLTIARHNSEKTAKR
ncbi:S-arrestin-like isoform X3 [Phycodurus eques]|uniref:S-arrestin-like isoform X3 n=1 Tax=Phycodurus eques TaxID=693459 RepID=UPI002ACE16BD|nr:S-arrestin-like isoform X3 [Phycodurus eques]